MTIIDGQFYAQPSKAAFYNCTNVHAVVLPVGHVLTIKKMYFFSFLQHNTDSCSESDASDSEVPEIPEDNPNHSADNQVDISRDNESVGSQESWWSEETVTYDLEMIGHPEDYDHNNVSTDSTNHSDYGSD